jgi:hypothetical protein
LSCLRRGHQRRSSRSALQPSHVTLTH